MKNLHDILWFISALHWEPFLPLLFLFAGKLRGDQFGAGMSRTNLTPRSIWVEEQKGRRRVKDYHKKYCLAAYSLSLSLSPPLPLSLPLSISPSLLSPISPSPLSSLNFACISQFFIHQPHYQEPISGCCFPPLQIYWPIGGKLQQAQRFTIANFIFVMDAKINYIIDYTASFIDWSLGEAHSYYSKVINRMHNYSNHMTHSNIRTSRHYLHAHAYAYYISPVLKASYGIIIDGSILHWTLHVALHNRNCMRGTTYSKSTLVCIKIIALFWE